MSERSLSKIAVVGAGSWGTALAMQLARIGHDVRLWARRSEHAEAIQRDRENARYLPGHKVADTLSATSDLSAALDGVHMVLSVVPSQTTRAMWSSAKLHLPAGVPIVAASKGIENMTLALMSEVLAAELPDHPHAFIAGPSFAKEVAKGLPTAIVVASKDAEIGAQVQHTISDDKLRAYVTEDVVGVEVGGALKNVIAIACGCADGLGFGQNTRAALITRGLAEITRVATKLGADPLTLAGLGGMGDLVLTCCGDLSRNRRVGLGLGEGKPLQQILDEMGQVAEGVQTAIAANDLAKRHQIDMPIASEIYKVLHEDKPAKAVVADLMGRSLKAENA